MHPFPNIRLSIQSMRPCSSRFTLDMYAGVRPQAHIKFVRAKSTKAQDAASTTKTTANLEASLRARAKKGDLPSEVEKEILPWGEYLAVRKNKRRWETVRTGSIARNYNLLEIDSYLTIARP